jgi:NADH-quinone oxidoreductase subunit N
LPFILLLCTTICVLISIAMFRNHRLAARITLGGLLLCFFSLRIHLGSGRGPVTPLLEWDAFSISFLAMVILSSALLCALSYRYLARERNCEEYYLLLLTATIGAAVLTCSVHLASFVLGLEVLSVSLYAMIAYFHEGKRAVEGGTKYLILAGFSSAFLLFGTALLYEATGTLSFAEIAHAIPDGDLVALAGTVLILVGVGFKLALVPFHMWAPDVYEAAPLPVTAFIATVSKGAVFAVLVRFALQLDFQTHRAFFILIAILAIASMTVGNLLALRQRNLKRLLAYSSTAQLGYLMVALAAGLSQGPKSAIFYAAAYFATTLAAFGVMIAQSEVGNERDSIEDYRGLVWRKPALAAVLAIALLSLAGIPLTAGFTGKFYIASAAIDSGLWTLIVLFIINSVIGLYYYLRVIAVMAAEAPELEASVVGETAVMGMRLPEHIALFILTFFIFWIGIFPTSMIRAVEVAAQSFTR